MDSDSSKYDENEEFQIPKNMYIVKPGENTNRGNGIIVCHTVNEIKYIVQQCKNSIASSTFDKVSDQQE